jgi:D-alanyl-lipoteichoic acid acyltransferase DltB (MBOAT superfamily)
MAGYRALRNSCRPLRSTSIAEFWNRYFYYFKELLVDFFFYPVYLRYFKGRPKLRLFFATLCAAGFGNVLFHYLDSVEYIAAHGPWEALLTLQVYGLYGLFLGTAIGISQIRSRHRQRHWLRERVLAPLSVITFYCVLSVFDDLDRSRSVSDHFAFLATLVGMGAG